MTNEYVTHRSYSLCQQASSGQDGASKNIYDIYNKNKNEKNNMRTITRTATEPSTGVFANIYIKTSGVKNGFFVYILLYSNSCLEGKKCHKLKGTVS
jgi:hypothetical protein